jgi:signal transduction histidine kinase/ActR/RegA family two-component response regulator
LNAIRNSTGKTGGSALCRFASLVFALLFAAACLCPPAAAADASSSAGQQIVHVGFFRFAGYHEMDTAGEKSGYGYDFLQMIAGYANFKYIYVGYQKSWNDMLDMLDSGEIDMLTYAVKLPQYAERFDFSEHSIGTSAAILTTSTANAAFAANDYRPFDGMRVGFIRDANRKEAFDAYAKKKNFSYTPVYYADLAGMQAALAAGSEIDAMVSDELRVLSDEVIIDKFDPQELYVMVKKGSTELLHAIDEAIRKLNMADPGWSLELQKKYFLSDYSASFSTTPAEAQYLESLSSSGKKLRVLYNPARYPFSFDQDGEPAGALVDIFKKIAAEYGLPYVFVKAGSAEAYYRLRRDDAADVVLDFVESVDEAEVLGYRLTSSYADTGCSVITLSSFTGTPGTAAVVSGSAIFREIAKAGNPRMKITDCASFDDCAAAVKSGAADCAYTYSITAQIYVAEDKTNRIKATQLNGRNFSFRLAVNSGADMALYGLLNKAAHSRDASDTTELLNAYLLDAKRSYSLWDYFTDHPAVLIAAVSAVVLVLVGFILFQRKNSRTLKTSNDALEASRGALENALTEANSANAAKTRFLSQMSHDIRTPLNGIIGMTYIAREQENPPRTADCLDKIDTSSKFLLGLINDVLDMSRMESSRVELKPEPYPIDEFKGYLDAVIRPLCWEKGQKFLLDEQFAITGFVPVADKLRCNQIIFNLLSNAVKYTPEGGTITYRIRGSLPEPGIMQIEHEIADTGIGMSEKFQKVLFEPFTQENRDDASENRGTGLGLAIVKRLVDQMGGTIAVQSSPGAGTRFLVTLRFGMVPASPPAVRAEGSEDAASRRFSLAGKHILLCEDHPLNQEIANVLLTEKRMIVSLADDGKAGLELFRDSPPDYFDAVLMDIRMPVMDGLEAAKAIRALDRQDAKDVPIIAMTADAFVEDVQKCMQAGMDGHIAKPIDPETLYRELEKHMQKNEKRGAENA